jgi:hypothetical protein
VQVAEVPTDGGHLPRDRTAGETAGVQRREIATQDPPVGILGLGAAATLRPTHELTHVVLVGTTGLRAVRAERREEVIHTPRHGTKATRHPL